jgi:spore coat protein A
MPTPKIGELQPYQDALPIPPKPNPFDLRGQGDEVCQTVRIMYQDVSYSAQLNPTKAWAYEGLVPGPTFVLDQSQTVHVRWYNTIDPCETLPYRVVVFPDPQDPTKPAQNDSGVAGGVLNDEAGALTASIVVHLHGGLTAPDSDGWAENVYPH